MMQDFDLLFGNQAGSLKPSQRATHTYVIGQPGVGKTRALESWIRQDIIAGHGVGVIDPHGDLFNDLLCFLSSKPEVWDRVIIFDPCNPKWVTPFNPLEAMEGLSNQRLSLFLTDIVVKIWGIDSANAPRMVWLLTNCFLALSDLKLTLLDLQKFLLDSVYRENLLPRLKYTQVQAYFQYEFPKNQAAVHQWVTPVLNKIGGLIFDPEVRLILASNSMINFRRILDRQMIFMANIPKGILGEGSSALLGAFLVAHIQKAALARADSYTRKNFYFYLDEFQNYTTDNIKDILSESRKYGLCLTLANQYLDQIPSGLRSAVLNTSGTIICFRVGYQDASHLVKEIFPSPDFSTTPKSNLKIKHLGPYPYLTIEQDSEPFGWDGLAQMLARLPSRQFWSKQRGSSSPAHHRTFDVPDPVITKELKERISSLLDASGRRYGKLKQDAQKEYARRYQTYHPNLNDSENSESPNEGSIPFWGN
jgi:TraM recognition site of TraD and TraG